MKRSLIPALLLVTLTCLNAHGQEQQVVVESNTTKYATGVFPADMVFELESGQRLMIATGNGMIELEGPHNGPAEGEPPSDASAFKTITRFVGTSASELSGLGGTRGSDDSADSEMADTRPSPWYIHAGITGAQCYVQGRPTEIWRSDTDQDSQFEIREASTDRIGVVSWTANEHAASWPSDLPPRHGEIYLVREAGRLQSGTSIRVFSLEPGAADDPFAAAAWLAARGCNAQARIALAALD